MRARQTFHGAWLGLLLTAAFSTTTAAADEAKTYSAAEVKEYFQMLEILDETKTHLYDKLVSLFGKKPSYHDDEVTTVLEPTEKYPYTDFSAKNEVRVGSPPPGALSAEVVRQYFAVQQKHNPKAKGSMAALEKNFGKHDWYLAREVRLVDQFGEPTKEYVYNRERDWTDVVAASRKAATVTPRLQRPLIRHDWSDLLYSEDLSQPGNVTKKVDDLVGATFSYAYDAKAETSTWSAIGAVIWPWVYHSAENRSDFDPETLAIAPSVSINRVVTNSATTKEVDQVFYRLGVYGEWSGTNPIDYVQARGAFVNVTDTSHEARLTGYEFDLEPRSFALAHSRLSLGARNILWPKEPRKKDDSDQSLIDYQIRAWLHMEGGNLQNNGKNWSAVAGDFFRIGPVLQLQINFPQLYKGFAISAQYSHVSALVGQDDHESLLKLGGALTLHQDKQWGQKVSLTLQYIKGGLDFTKDDAEALTIGLGVVF